MVHKSAFTSKGVTTSVSDSVPTPVIFSESDATATERTSSLHRVKNDIQTVLDLMGPSTPTIQSQHHHHQETTEDENEDTSISSSILKDISSSVTTHREAQQMASIIEESDHCCSLHHVPQENGDSHLADYGSNTTLDELSSILSNMGLLSPNHRHDGAHICVNQHCRCMKEYLQQNILPMVSQKLCKCANVAQKHLALSEDKKEKLVEWVKRLKNYELKIKKKQPLSPCELYRVNIQEDGDGQHPKRLIFDLVEGLPKPYATSVATNTRKDKAHPTPVMRKARRKSTKASNTVSGKRHDVYATMEKRTRRCRSTFTPHKANIGAELKQQKSIEKKVKQEDEGKLQQTRQSQESQQKYTFYDSNGDTRVDFYYFDHGNAEFLNTTDSQPVMRCEMIAEKTEKYTTKFWAEFFASIHIAISFAISFLLQLFKFLLYSIIRPLTVGMMQLASDYFFKPCLTTLFNGLFQPFLIFLYNIITTIRDLFDPLAECCGYFLRELSILCKSIRLCNYKKTKTCHPDRDVKCITA